MSTCAGVLPEILEGVRFSNPRTTGQERPPKFPVFIAEWVSEGPKDTKFRVRAGEATSSQAIAYSEMAQGSVTVLTYNLREESAIRAQVPVIPFCRLRKSCRKSG